MNFALAIHGGASNQTFAPSLLEEKKQALHQSLEAGYTLLKSGKSSLDAVQAAIVILEDSEFFNAGKGAVLTQEKTVELDASIMSSDSKAGAVGAVKSTKNPILLARQIMENTPHALLVGEKADEFALQQGLEMVPNSYFMTEAREKEWQRLAEKADNLGTVGAIALDQDGNLASATSTGGIQRKMAGRVGDSAIIGAGTYANPYCAVSCTGRGENFIRQSIASFVCHLVRFGVPLEEAARRAIFEELAAVGGKGGLIAIDQMGNCAMPFSTLSMIRAYWQADGEPVVFIS